jgi:hypothetical protein
MQYLVEQVYRASCWTWLPRRATPMGQSRPRRPRSRRRDRRVLPETNLYSSLRERTRVWAYSGNQASERSGRAPLQRQLPGGQRQSIHVGECLHCSWRKSRSHQNRSRAGKCLCWLLHPRLHCLQRDVGLIQECQPPPLPILPKASMVP